MVKVGVIGTGRWGINHVRVYSELENAELVGIADICPEKKALADEYKTGFFTDYKELLKKIDAVSVVVPTTMHFEVVRDCLNAGKHVLVEKPVTLNSWQALELIELAKRKNLILNVGYLYRFNSAVRKLKELIKNAGDVHYISARYIHSDKPPRTDSGAVFNLSIHLIDILNFVLEKTPEKVFCKKINYLSKEREDCAVIVLDYGNFMAELEVSWFHPLKKRDMWVIGSKKKVYADFLEQVVQEYTGFSSFRNIEIRKNEPLKEELRYFCSAAEGKENGKNEGAEEINILKVCEACLKSAEKGEEVKI